MERSEGDFHQAIARALAGCQFVELQLEVYITDACDLVRKCIGNQMIFKLSGRDYCTSSLGRRIDVFAKLTNNEQLVNELRAFVKERNFLSHRAVTDSIDPDGDVDLEPQDMERLRKIEAEGTKLAIKIHEEANKFRGYLEFDDLDQHKEAQ